MSTIEASQPHPSGEPPRVIVLIPHYDNPAGLYRSLASIGTNEICDVLVVDDGSVRLPIDYAAARAAFHAHGIVRFLNLPQNRGIEHALNSGLQWISARGYERVARLDCGDENIPDRLATQMAFLDMHPAVMLLGGAASMIDPVTGIERFVLHHPTHHADIRQAMQVNSAFIHPTVMFRTVALEQTGLYPLDVPAAEDYALFWSFVNHFETANLPEVLIRYELDPGGISLSKRKQQLKSRLLLQHRHNDGGIAAWLGIARTIALLVLPYEWVFKLKVKLRKGKV